ncbi:MAG TPA: DUF1488 family protein [Alphaproteobacteria bacterium]|nr:DUF1488 family protein [Alphaproteobacteria bacterium]
MTASLPLFSFPDDPIWNEALQAVEMKLVLGEYEAAVYVPLRVIQAQLGRRPSPEEALAAVFQGQALFEQAARNRVTDRAIDPDGQVHLTARDLARARAALSGD